MHYKNEAAFKQALISEFKKQGCFVQCIETGQLGLGVPDFVAGRKGREVWIETKIVHAFLDKNNIKIPWRKGQKAWALQYLKQVERPCYTVCAFNDSILVLPLTQTFPGDLVPAGCCRFYKVVSDIRFEKDFA